MNDETVRDDRAHERFILERDGATAVLIYRDPPGRLVLVHTEVPDALAGHGLGGLLVRAAIERAASEGRTVEPRCPFARRWLENHPDVAATAVVDWDAV